MELQDTLDRIEQLQKTEEHLYTMLSTNAENIANGNLAFTESEVVDITSQINALSTTRVNLYNVIANIYKSQTTNEKNAQASLNQQTTTLQLLEEELNKSKKKLANMKDYKNNQLKMIEINTYYSKQYDAYRRLMRLITIIGVLLLVSILLEHTPLYMVSRPLTILVCIVGGIVIILRVFNMMSRSSYNYDEIKWFPPVNQTSSSTQIGVSDTIGTPYVCAEQSCCSYGTVWSDASGCVVDTQSSSS